MSASAQIVPRTDTGARRSTSAVPALAQSEAYRLRTTAERLAHQLEGATRNIQTAIANKGSGENVVQLKAAIKASVTPRRRGRSCDRPAAISRHLPVAVGIAGSKEAVQLDEI